MKVILEIDETGDLTLKRNGDHNMAINISIFINDEHLHDVVDLMGRICRSMFKL